VSDGRLTDAELEAIRARAEAERQRVNGMGYVSRSGPARERLRDAILLLAALDAALADLAAAGGEVEGLNHVVACMKNDRLAYQMGVEDERRRIVEWLRAEASRAMSAGAVVTAGALRAEAHLIESPPAPAAAKEGE
jgi:hypothetical protein